jgi:hypothetical protein
MRWGCDCVTPLVAWPGLKDGEHAADHGHRGMVAARRIPPDGSARCGRGLNGTLQCRTDGRTRHQLGGRACAGQARVEQFESLTDRERPRSGPPAGSNRESNDLSRRRCQRPPGSAAATGASCPPASCAYATSAMSLTMCPG